MSSSEPQAAGGTAGLETPRYPCFDGIRAIAVLMVIVFHAVFFTSFFRTTGRALLWNLNTGVWVFFVTSGFLLYRPFAAAHLSSKPGINVAGYALRRVARIYPAYWVALSFFLFIVPKTTIEGATGYVLHFTLTQTYQRVENPYFSGLPLAWSLVVEVTFYAFLPLYAAIISRAVRRWNARDVEVWGGVTLVMLGIASLVFVAEGYDALWIRVLPVHLPAFGLGILLAVVSTVRWGNRMTPVLAQMGSRPWLWWALAVAMFLATPIIFGGEPFATPTTPEAVGRAIFQSLFGLFLVIPAVFGPQDRGWVRGLLRSRPLAWLGLISYGLYLWHWFLLLTVQDDWLGWSLSKGNWFLLLCVSMPVVIAAAALSWYLLERPILRWVHSVTRSDTWRARSPLSNPPSG